MSDEKNRGWVALPLSGPAGVFNPCHIEPKGNWCDESGRGGQPAPPAESMSARRTREMTDAWKIQNYDLAENAELMTSLAPKIYEEMQQQMVEGESAEVALANVTAAIRRVIPKPADEGRWRADEQVRFLEQERRRHNQGLGIRPK